jgi:transposase-like protein
MLAHKVRIVIGKVPDDTQAELKAMVHSAYYAPNREVAEMIAKDLLECYQDQYPSAMKSFTNDLEACWSYMRCPTVHHKRIRTTNLLERAFVEQKRRTKIIPGFWTEKSCLKLVFATLWQASQRWRGVRMSEFEHNIHPSITPVNTFRLIFDEFFGGEYGFLENVSYFSTYENPYNYEVVPLLRENCGK